MNRNGKYIFFRSLLESAEGNCVELNNKEKEMQLRIVSLEGDLQMKVIDALLENMNVICI